MLVGLAATLAASCADRTRECTLIGFTSSVTVTGHPGIAIDSFCLDDTCVDEPGAPLNLAVDDEPETYGYRISVTASGAARVLTGEVTTEAFEVNGRGCGPRTANASIEINRRGDAAPAVPFVPGTPATIASD